MYLRAKVPRSRAAEPAAVTTRPAVAHASVPQTHALRHSIANMASDIPRGHVVQARWLDIDSAYYEWEGLIGGLQWYAHKKTNMMYFVVVDEGEIAPDERKFYKDQQGALRTRERWLTLDKSPLVEGKWSAEDAAIIGPNAPKAQGEQPPVNAHAVGPGLKAQAIGNKASIEGRIEAVIKDLYFTGGKKIENFDVITKLKQLRTLGPKWEELAADPAIIMKPNVFEQFMKFAKEHPESKADPWGARTNFARTLGASTVYRAIWVREDVAKRLDNAQLKSQETLLPASCAKLKEACECAKVLENVELMLRDHVEGRGAGLTQSVTTDPKIAIAVANRVRIDTLKAAQNVFLGTEEHEGKNIYLLQLAIPNLDLFYVGDFTKDYDNFIVKTNRQDEIFPTAYSSDAERIVIGNIKGVSVKSVMLVEEPTGYAQTIQ
jgi:hypothetical protein